MEEDEKLELVKLDVLRNHPKYGELMSLLIEAGVITRQGIRLQGMGIFIKHSDRTNQLLSFIEKKIEKLGG